MYKVLNMTECRGVELLFESLKDVVEIITLPPDRETALSVIDAYDGYITSLRFRVDKAFIDRATRLKAVFTPSTGLDHIDLVYAAEKGIAVFGMKNDRAFLDGITSTAELGLGLLLGVIRRIPWGFQSALKGKWARDRFLGMQLTGKTMGILGYGRLGAIMASYAKALRMHVLACDIVEIADESVEQVSFQELMSASDVLSLHIHLNDSTRGIIGREAIDAMKPGIIIINTSRGGIIDETALLAGLLSGHIGAAGLDVIDGEWREDLVEHPLIQYAATHENLLISPHIGGVSFEAQLMTMENTLKKVRAFFEGGGVIPDWLLPSKMN